MKKRAIEKNIFEEINRTIELKNKLTVAKNNINKVIVRGGGVRSATLVDMAKNIQGMLGQYKKISISMPNISIVSQNFTIKTNADFIVNNAYIFLETREMTQSPIGVDIKDLKNFKNIAIPSNLGYVTNVRMKASIQNQNEILLVIDGMDNTSWIIISKIVVTN